LVNRHLDRLLHDGPADVQTQFLEGLAWLDGYCIRQHSQPFVRGSEPQQTGVLESLDSGSGRGYEFFEMAKNLTAQVY
jgi:hypothetical protein